MLLWINLYHSHNYLISLSTLGIPAPRFSSLCFSFSFFLSSFSLLSDLFGCDSENGILILTLINYYNHYEIIPSFFLLSIFSSISSLRRGRENVWKWKFDCWKFLFLCMFLCSIWNEIYFCSLMLVYVNGWRVFKLFSFKVLVPSLMLI